MRVLRKGLLVVMSFVLALALTACAADGSASSSASGGAAGSEAPSGAASTSAAAGDGAFASFSATDLAGNAVDQSVLADYTITMVNVWATFCSPCLSEMPDLGALHAAYADKGVQVVGLVTDVVDKSGESVPEQVALAEQLVQETGAAYLHVVPSREMFEGVLRDVSAVPTTFFVDAQGNTLTKPYLGARSGAEWEKIIDELLQSMA